MIIDQKESNQIVADRFQHTEQTISHHFEKALKIVVRYVKELIMPPSFAETPPEIRCNPKYYPYFKVFSYVHIII